MKKGLLGVILGLLVALAVPAGAATKLTCTLTGKTVEKCCCVVQKDGKLYCTLAKKTVETCCCKESGK